MFTVTPGAPSPAPAIRQAHYLDALENVLEGPGDDASLAGRVRQALHGEGLPAARLAVGKDGAIVAFSYALRGGHSPALSWPGMARLGAGPGAGGLPPDSGTRRPPNPWFSQHGGTGWDGCAEMEAAPLVG